VTLTFCWDLAAADWIVHSDLPWQQLVGFGPAGFDAYARLRFLPDPIRPGQSENDVDADWRTDQLPTLFEVLTTHTTTPDSCYFCVWEGFGGPVVVEAACHRTREHSRHAHDAVATFERSTPSAAYPSPAKRRQISRMLSLTPEASWTTTTPGCGPFPSGIARYDLPRDSTRIDPMWLLRMHSATLRACRTVRSWPRRARGTA
jgi:hypothetical protein